MLPLQSPPPPPAHLPLASLSCQAIERRHRCRFGCLGLDMPPTRSRPTLCPQKYLSLILHKTISVLIICFRKLTLSPESPDNLPSPPPPCPIEQAHLVSSSFAGSSACLQAHLGLSNCAICQFIQCQFSQPLLPLPLSLSFFSALRWEHDMLSSRLAKQMFLMPIRRLGQQLK